MNRKVLISGAEYYSVKELNPYEHQDIQPDVELSIHEHALLEQSLRQAGIEIVKVPAPKSCQDGIYTANWGLCWRDKAVLSTLPNMRKGEEPYAEEVIRSLGYDPIKTEYRFSGQGDCLPCGNYLFVGSQYRTDREMHEYLKRLFDCEVVGLEAVPQIDSSGNPVINAVTHWPNSYFYDLDLALAVITPELIAWCPEAFTSNSQEKIKSLPLDKIEVSLSEAKGSFACNLVSTGEIVVMGDNAPVLKAEIEKRGLRTITPHITELSKGGGYIRCCSLTLD